MTYKEAVNWIINLTADIGKIEHQDLWHYEQALSEMREMLESAQERKTGRWIAPSSEGWVTYDRHAYRECSACGSKQYLAHKMNYCPNCGAKMLTYTGAKMEVEHERTQV